METRKKIELIIAVVVIVIFIVMLAVFLRQPVQDEVAIQDDTTDQLNEVPSRAARATEIETSDIPKTSTVSATTIARTFVERFGSYSSESNFANVEDIKSLATEDFQTDLEEIIDKARKQADGAYYGISTIVITTKSVDETDTAMTLRMTTQREEAIDDPSKPIVRYQEIVVDLVKVGDNWLVDGFTWE